MRERFKRRRYVDIRLRRVTRGHRDERRLLSGKKKHMGRRPHQVEGREHMGRKEQHMGRKKQYVEGREYMERKKQHMEEKKHYVEMREHTEGKITSHGQEDTLHYME